MRIPVSMVTSGKVSRRDGTVVVAMRHYPRFLAKDQKDDYLRSLAPHPTLFSEFKSEERSSKDHDGAFLKVDYQRRFCITDAGAADLKRLSALAEDQNVYLVCQCKLEERCHCDLLLLIARKWFGTLIMNPPCPYPEFNQRLESTSFEKPSDIVTLA